MYLNRKEQDFRPYRMLELQDEFETVSAAAATAASDAAQGRGDPREVNPNSKTAHRKVWKVCYGCDGAVFGYFVLPSLYVRTNHFAICIVRTSWACCNSYQQTQSFASCTNLVIFMCLDTTHAHSHARTHARAHKHTHTTHNTNTHRTHTHTQYLI